MLYGSDPLANKMNTGPRLLDVHPQGLVQPVLKATYK